MTLPVINAARRVLIVVGGAEKAPIVPRAVAGAFAASPGPSAPAGRR